MSKVDIILINLQLRIPVYPWLKSQNNQKKITWNVYTHYYTIISDIPSNHVHGIQYYFR